jgi:hypothetical protein
MEETKTTSIDELDLEIDFKPSSEVINRNVDDMPPEEQVAFWQSFVEGLSHNLSWHSKKHRESRTKIKELEAKLKVAVEALEKYADKDLWSIGGGTNEIPCFNKFMEHSIDTEWFEKYRHHVSGGIARLALEKIKAK